MILLTQNSLNITISDVEPAQRRERIIKALAASIRWSSYKESKILADNENVYELAKLLDELTDTDIIE